jgi:hypothetical protein
MLKETPRKLRQNYYFNLMVSLIDWLDGWLADWLDGWLTQAAGGWLR